MTMKPYDNEPAYNEKYGAFAARLVTNRKAKAQSEAFQIEFKTLLTQYFTLEQYAEYAEILEQIQDAIDDLAPLLGNFDPAVEAIKQQPESLKQIRKEISAKAGNSTTRVGRNLTAHSPQEKFRLVATYFYNFNDWVNDDGDALIVKIADLCLEGVQKALA